MLGAFATMPHVYAACRLLCALLTLGYYRVKICITILSKIYFYFTAGNCRYYAEKARGAALKIENGVICC